MKKLPHARNVDLVLQQSGKELLIYDLKIHQAYCLNETSAIVWQKCDGVTTFDELTRQTNLPKDLILLTLDGLQKENLLEDKIETQISADRLSRRKMILTTAGAVAVALPLITTLVSPVAAQSGSCVADGLPTVGFSTPAQGPSVACQNASNTCCTGFSANAHITDQTSDIRCDAACGKPIT